MKGSYKVNLTCKPILCSKLSEKMVRLHVKKGEESHFLYDTHVEARVEDIIYDITIIYNGRLKVSRICYGNDRLYLEREVNQIEKDDISNNVAKENLSAYLKVALYLGTLRGLVVS